MHVDEFIAIADQHLPGRACPQKETCRDASSSAVLTYATIQKHHGSFSQEKFSPATLEWEMQDIKRPRTVLFTAVTGSTLSLIEVWNGSGHAFTEDGLAARA
jgi:hypothetical protein